MAVAIKKALVANNAPKLAQKIRVIKNTGWL
jgi:hypothetical protein